MALLLLLAASVCLAAVKPIVVPPLPASAIASAVAGLPATMIVVPSNRSALEIGANVLPTSRQSLELSSLNLAIRFDGAGKLPAAPLPVSVERPAFTTFPYLRSTHPEDQAWLDSVSMEMRRSRTARTVLRRVEALAAAQGRPVPVEITDIRPLAGEFNFDTEVVRMKTSLKRREVSDAASVLAHELLHVVQKADGLPSALFEMELEAYMLDIRVAYELGGEYGQSKWDRQIAKHFRKGVRPLVDFLLGGLYKNDLSVLKLGLEGVREGLYVRMAESKTQIARLEGRLAKRRETAAELRRMGQPEAQVLQYEVDEVAKLERKLSDERTVLAWHERDAALLDTPEGRAKALAYARRVRQYARNTHRWYLDR